MENSTTINEPDYFKDRTVHFVCPASYAEHNYTQTTQENLVTVRFRISRHLQLSSQSSRLSHARQSHMKYVHSGKEFEEPDTVFCLGRQTGPNSRSGKLHSLRLCWAEGNHVSAVASSFDFHVLTHNAFLNNMLVSVLIAALLLIGNTAALFIIRRSWNFSINVRNSPPARVPNDRSPDPSNVFPILGRRKTGREVRSHTAQGDPANRCGDWGAKSRAGGYEVSESTVDKKPTTYLCG